MWDVLVRETVARRTSYTTHEPLNSKDSGSATGQDGNSGQGSEWFQPGCGGQGDWLSCYHK